MCLCLTEVCSKSKKRKSTKTRQKKKKALNFPKKCPSRRNFIQCGSLVLFPSFFCFFSFNIFPPEALVLPHLLVYFNIFPFSLALSLSLRLCFCHYSNSSPAAHSREGWTDRKTVRRTDGQIGLRTKNLGKTWRSVPPALLFLLHLHHFFFFGEIICK